MQVEKHYLNLIHLVRYARKLNVLHRYFNSAHCAGTMPLGQNQAMEFCGGPGFLFCRTTAQGMLSHFYINRIKRRPIDHRSIFIQVKKFSIAAARYMSAGSMIPSILSRGKGSGWREENTGISRFLPPWGMGKTFWIADPWDCASQWSCQQVLDIETLTLSNTISSY